MEDAEKALEFGADMLGFNFYAPSPRAIAPEQARQIIERLPAESFNVALFVNESRENVADVIGSAKLVDGRQAYRGLQFHGEESAEYCRGWNMKIIKAFRLKGRDGLAGMNDFPADFYLLDSWTAGYGGSGDDVSLGMGRGLRCRQAYSLRRAAGGKCRRCDPASSSLRCRRLQRRGVPPGYEGSCKTQRLYRCCQECLIGAAISASTAGATSPRP